MDYETKPQFPEDGNVTGYLIWYYEMNEHYHLLEEIRNQINTEMWNGQSDSDNIYLQQPYDGKE
jgi:hypothetical protein